MRWLIVILLVAVVALQLRLWAGEGGRQDVRRLRAAVEAQIAENERLRERNERLAAEVEDLREGLEAAEARARSELGMIRPGEVFYQVVEPDQDPEPRR